MAPRNRHIIKNVTSIWHGDRLHAVKLGRTVFSPGTPVALRLTEHGRVTGTIKELTDPGRNDDCFLAEVLLDRALPDGTTSIKRLLAVQLSDRSYKFFMKNTLRKANMPWQHV